MIVSEIEYKIKKLRSVLESKDEKRLKDSNSDEEYLSMIKPEWDEINLLDRQLRLIMEYTFRELDDFGDVMSLEDFIENVKDGNFIDYDGSGYYIKDDKRTNIEIYASDIIANVYRKDFDTIVWYNR